MSLSRRAFVAAAIAASLSASALAADPPREIRIDWAYYNPVSLVLKDQGLIEKEFEEDGITVTWVQSQGSNKALEFLNAGSLDFGSTAGAAALIGRINGNPVKSIYVYSRPEWTALVTREETGIASVKDLSGKSIAVTRGTDPHIFLVRALAEAGLTEKDVTLVLLQHADGKLALLRGDVDSWAGLDPMMAAAEIENGAALFYRNTDFNSWGILNTREAFAAEHPDIVRRVLATYEQAREWAITHPDDLKQILVSASQLPPEVIDRQIDERTDLSHSSIGDPQKETILAAGQALQQAGVINPDVDVQAAVDALVDTGFSVETQ
jgi:sulfonate transport system substrate-binding protein